MAFPNFFGPRAHRRGGRPAPSAAGLPDVHGLLLMTKFIARHPLWRSHPDRIARALGFDFRDLGRRSRTPFGGKKVPQFRFFKRLTAAACISPS